MGKKGASLVELIAVIVIMGIIAGIAIPTTIVVIKRQRINATISSLNNIYSFTKERLISVETGNYEDFITIVDESFCYTTLTELIDSGAIDGGEQYIPEGNEVYFCYNMSEPYVVITNGDISRNKPASTGSTLIDSVLISFDYNKGLFVKA